MPAAHRRRGQRRRRAAADGDQQIEPGRRRGAVRTRGAARSACAPSSSISPSTATLRALPGRRRHRLERPARAPPGSSCRSRRSSVTPPGSRSSSPRWCAGMQRAPRARRSSSSGTPNCSATADRRQHVREVAEPEQRRAQPRRRRPACRHRRGHPVEPAMRPPTVARTSAATSMPKVTTGRRTAARAP